MIREDRGDEREVKRLSAACHQTKLACVSMRRM